jgi:CheY-like chemotaxis protein
VGQLTGGIAHDFNNLLTVIHGNLQVLADWPALADDEGALQMVAAAARAARRGADLTAKLLAFSRRQVLQPKAIVPARTLASLAELLRRTLDARIRIVVDVDPECPPCLADPGQLESALLNIAINARDAMPDGGTLAFRARRCSPGELPELPGNATDGWTGDGVVWSVADTGVGMSEAVLARAFEPFFTTKEAGRGTGLGLATVHGFAHQSNGAVDLASRVGVGTTVSLYLPGVGTAPTEAPRAAAVQAVVPAGLRVLLVEDEPEVLRVVQAFLAAWGCAVTPCTRADDALAALDADRSVAFDLLVSDVVLGPGLRGTELVQRAHQLRPGLPALLLSGYAYEAPVTDAPLLRKPFTREQLAQSIVRALGR